MTRPDWAPAGVDIDRPNAARMYDYFLGGSHNVGADREVADLAIAALPELPRIAEANRDFLRRAIHYCLRAGVRQFLDIGSGIPTVGNVHELAQRADPAARVAYVDTDPVAVAHAQAILAGNDRAVAIQEDARRPEAIIGHPDVRRMLDLDRPVALLLVAVLHFIPDADQPGGLVARLVAPLVPGSQLVISHGAAESPPDQGGPVLGLYRRTTTPIFPRPRATIEGYFTGLELIDPGVVWMPEWRPDVLRDVDEPADWCHVLAGGARKP